MTRKPGTDPFKARRWREAGSEGAYADMDPDVQPEGTPEPRQVTHSMPEGGSIATVLAWVDGDPTRAQIAYDAEWARDTQRTSLLDQLRKVLQA